MTQADSAMIIITPGVASKPGKWMIMDQTDLHWCPDLATQGLHVVGQQTLLRAPGIDQVAYLFGSVDPFLGDGLFEIYDRKRSEEFCLHLEHLSELYPYSFLFIGCDYAPAHRSHDTALYLKDRQQEVELVYFPTYSPNLNGMEHLWRYLRKNMTRNTTYESLSAECLAICGWVEALTSYRIIQTLGTVKKLTKAK